ncbi:MAG: sulfatase-like hydrolase/transferase [Victivallales bacterium]|nr:sulfatase-like hydrolase/transferase [Victivallales bacterium]
MATQPNIILVTADQLQAFALGCYGNPDVQTPNIDRLAAAGVQFRYGLSNAPVCMAGRSVLLSGQHNRSCTGGVSNVHYEHGKAGSYPMPEYPGTGRPHFPNATLPELLHDAGYHTAAIGKWHMYTWPDVIGFDQYVIPRTHHIHSYQHYTENGGPEFVPEGWSMEYETDRADQFIRSQTGDQPFFLYLNYSPPHGPIDDCPAEYREMYDPVQLTLRANVDEANDFPSEHDRRVYRWDFRYYELALPYTLQPMTYTIRDIYAHYYGNITWLDDNVGRVTQALAESGQLENTIVVFTADHGDNLGSHCRCGKGQPFDESLRVPMLYSCPDRLAPRLDEHRLAGLLDVAPTLLSMAGTPIPPHMQGSDVFSEEADVGIVEVHPGRITARITRFTAHLNANGEGQRLAFYDNQGDPYQMTNLAGTNAFAKEQDRLFAILQAHHRNTPILPQPDYGFQHRN